MVFVQPEARVGDKEVAHFVPAEVENVRAPVGMLAARGVGILVQRGAVEASQCERVLGEVGGNPVHDDADAGLMEFLDQILEIVRSAETGIDGVIPGHLIAPRAGEGVFGQRHELDVGETFLGDVVDELVGEVAIILDALLPAAGVDFVDADRTVMRIGALAAVHPCGVVPCEGRIDYNGTGCRRNFVRTFHRIGFHDPLIVRIQDLVLVDFAVLHTGDEQLPDAGRSQLAHGVLAAVPAVEIADDAYRVRIGRPYAECRADQGFAAHAVAGTHRVLVMHDTCAECLPQPLVAPLAEQVHIEIADRRQVAIWIVLNRGLTVLVRRGDTVIRDTPAVIGGNRGDVRVENPVVLVGRRVLFAFAVPLGDDVDLLGERAQHAYGDGAVGVVLYDMPAEYLMRVEVGRVADSIQLSLVYSEHGDISIDPRVVHSHI